MGTAILIVTGIIAFMVFIFGNVLALFSLVSGWRRLSLKYPVVGPAAPSTVVYSFQSISMGFVSYTMIVFTAFTETGITISTFWPFTFMHKPFVIDYDKITDIKKGTLLSPFVTFRFEGKKIKMQGRCVAELEKRIVSEHAGPGE